MRSIDGASDSGSAAPKSRLARKARLYGARYWQRLLGSVAFLGSIALEARANGRFPLAQMLREDPSNPARLALANTHGLLLSQNRGQDWYWVCERQILGNAYLASNSLDLFLEILPDGSLLSGSPDGIATSSDFGCTWTTELQASASNTGPTRITLQIVDVTLNRCAPERSALALVSHWDKAGRNELHRIWQRDAEGTWTPADLPVLENSELPVAHTFETAASAPCTVYVSGKLPDGSMALLASEFGSPRWRMHSIPETSENVAPYIAAVDPGDSRAVYLRINRRVGEDSWRAEDRVLTTQDGGASWTELMRAGASAMGFALLPGERRALVAYGDPMILELGINDEDLGVYEADLSTLAVTHRLHFSSSCLGVLGERVYLCPKIGTQPTQLGSISLAELASDAQPPLEPALTARAVLGPLPAPPAREPLCWQEWAVGTMSPRACDLFDKCASDAPAPKPGFPQCSTSVPRSSTGGAGNTSGTAGKSSDNSKGCACHVAPREATSYAPRLAFFIGFLGMLGRRVLRFVDSYA